jgi:hypothetical protein
MVEREKKEKGLAPGEGRRIRKEKEERERRGPREE